MDADDYQNQAKETAIYPKGMVLVDIGLLYNIVSVGAEAGEFLGKYSKFIRDKYNREALLEFLRAEGGDIIWHLATLFDDNGISFSDVMQENLDKLKDRANRGVLSGSGDNR